MADKIYLYKLATAAQMAGLKPVLEALASKWLFVSRVSDREASVSASGYLMLRRKAVAGRVNVRGEEDARRYGDGAIMNLLRLVGGSHLSEANKGLVKALFYGVRFMSAVPPADPKDPRGVWRMLYRPYLRARPGEEAQVVADSGAYISLEVELSGQPVGLEVHLRAVVGSKLEDANKTPDNLPILKNKSGDNFIAYRVDLEFNFFVPNYLIINKNPIFSEYQFLPAVFFKMPSKSVTKALDIDSFAKSIGVEPEILLAIAQQESKRASFDEKGRPIILFEPYRFYRLIKKSMSEVEIKGLKEKYREINIISYSSRTDLKLTRSQYYGSDDLQYKKISIAASINQESAILSTSWGKYQIMGFNYATCGYKNVYDFKDAMQTVEGQLLAFSNFCKNNKPLLKSMRVKDWEGIANGYNGEDWKSENPNYANDIKKYYSDFKNN